MKTTNKRTHQIVLIGLLSAVSLVLRQFDFPILPAAPFLKFDFSEIPAMVGLLTMGMPGLLGVTIVRDVLNWIIRGGQMGLPLGSIMSSLATLAMFVPTHIYLKKGYDLSKKKDAFVIGLTSALSLTLVLSLVNYFIMLPIFTKVMDFEIGNKLTYVLLTVAPFNLIKGIIYAFLQYYINKAFQKHASHRLYYV